MKNDFLDITRLLILDENQIKVFAMETQSLLKSISKELAEENYPVSILLVDNDFILFLK